MKTSFYRKKGKLTLLILALAVISQSVASCGRKNSRSTEEPVIDISTLEDYSPEQLEQMNSGDEEYELDVNESGYLENIYGTYSNVKVNSCKTALASLYNIKSIMKINDPYEELRLLSVYRDEVGCIYRFEQIYKDLPVLDNQVYISVDENGKVDCLSSSYIPVSNNPATSPKIGIAEAVKQAGSAGCGKVSQDSEIELCIFNEDGTGRLVWFLYCEDEKWNGYEVLVDAKTGEVVQTTKVSCDL